MSAALQLQDSREQIYSRLKSQSLITPNHEWLACMLASWCDGQGVLPDCLGLENEQFIALKKHFFPGFNLSEQAPSGSKLDFGRMLEKQDLVNLLKQYAKPGLPDSNHRCRMLR